jgi:hypothetical protein
MMARHQWCLLAFASLLACYYPATGQPVTSPEPDSARLLEPPPKMQLGPEFSGDPVQVNHLEGGIVVEILAEGEGEGASHGQMVLFDYAAWRVDTNEQIPAYKKRMRVGEGGGNPILAALQMVLDGARAGMRARVFLPAAYVDAAKPARAPAVGDVWLTIEIQQVRDYPQIVEFDAFAGEPIATKVLDDGIVVHDYTPGQGRAAVAGDLVEFVTIAESVHDDVMATNPYEVAVTLTVSSHPPNEVLEGARYGMLRSFVIPKGYVLGQFPPTKHEHVHYMQITWVDPQ